MELDLTKALLLSFLSILALSLPCRAASWLPGSNLSATAQPQCNIGEAGCRIADQQPELEAMVDPGMLGASLAVAGTKKRNSAGCGRKSPNGRYTPCPPTPNSAPKRCYVYTRVC